MTEFQKNPARTISISGIFEHLLAWFNREKIVSRVPVATDPDGAIDITAKLLLAARGYKAPPFAPL